MPTSRQPTRRPHGGVRTLTLGCSGPVIVVDDHDLVGSSIVLMLRHEGFDARRIRVVSQEGILEEAGVSAYGVALVDLDIRDVPERPKVSGVDLVAALRCSGWRPVVISGAGHDEEIAEGVAAGALGVVRKSSSAERLVVTVRAVLDHGQGIPPSEREHYLSVAECVASRREAGRAPLNHLSRRELQVLQRLAEGHRAAAIAQEFVTSISTVRSQIRSILAKLGVGSQLEAVALLHTANGTAGR